jgi:hypothetical protein
MKLTSSTMFLQGLETVDNSYFITEDNIGMLKLAKEANTILVRPYSFLSPCPVNRSFLITKKQRFDELNQGLIPIDARSSITASRWTLAALWPARATTRTAW